MSFHVLLRYGNDPKISEKLGSSAEPDQATFKGCTQFLVIPAPMVNSFHHFILLHASY